MFAGVYLTRTGEAVGEARLEETLRRYNIIEVTPEFETRYRKAQDQCLPGASTIRRYGHGGIDPTKFWPCMDDWFDLPPEDGGVPGG